MALPDDERQALRTRLAPGGDATAEAVSRAVEEGEELREVVVDGHGDVVAFTDRRALFVGADGSGVQPVGYDAIEVRRRDHGLAIDALIDGGRLVLEVARGTFVRLAVVAAGAPPGRATWLPTRQPLRREPAPSNLPTAPPRPPGDEAATAGGAAVEHAPSHRLPPPMPAPAGATMPPPVPPVEPGHGAGAGPTPLPTAPPVPPAPPAGLPPAGWNPDPSGRHWWRWWDGRGWTDHVADGGATYTDPLPPRP